MTGTFKRFNLLLRAANTRILTFLAPSLLAIIASFGEGLTLIFLIPTIKGMIDKFYHPFYSLPSYLQKLIPGLQAISRQEAIILCLMCTLAAAFVKILFAYLSSLLTTKNLKAFSARLRIKLYERYLSFGKLFFDQSNLGHLQQIITTYVSLISISLGAIQSSLYALATMLIYFAMMLYISYKLTAVVILAFPLLHYSLKQLIRTINDTSNSHTDSYNQLVKGISNSLSTISLVKAYSKEAKEAERFAGMATEVSSLEFNIEKNTLLVGPIQELILLLFLFFLVGLVALVFASDNPAVMANYAVFFVILKRAATLFGVFSSISAALASVSGPIIETSEILNNEKKFFIPEGSLVFEDLKDSIVFEDLNFSYPGGMKALSGFSLKIKRGENLAIVGQSGSGKSTLIHLLMRYYDSPAGSIKVDGVDIRDFTLKSWLKNIALVSQDTYLFNASLRDNLVYGLEREVDEKELAEVLRRARLEDFISQLPDGLNTEIGDRGVKLSGGEKQRVSIARAILKGAGILLLDEATSALDSRTEKLVQQALDDLIRTKTSLTVAHRLSTVKNATSVIVIENGRIVEQGSFEDLIKSKGALSGYWHEQQI